MALHFPLLPPFDSHLHHRRKWTQDLPSFFHHSHLSRLNQTSSSSKEEQEDENVVHRVPALYPRRPRMFNTTLDHIVFGIAASSVLWDTRKEYIKSWWRPGKTRVVVCIDKRVRTYRNEPLPEIRISQDTTRFRYTHPVGDRSAVRISRVVTETLRLGKEGVRWFVMGDDDTVFVVDNVVNVLSKYDHTQFYYVGSSSEAHVQNIKINGKTEKIATWLLDPFLALLKTAEEQVAKGGYSVILIPRLRFQLSRKERR